MKGIHVPLALTLAMGVAGCAPEQPPLRGVRTGISLDRTASLVGDPLGVTIEVETPPGYRLELPATPVGDGPFVTESIQKLEPFEIPGGVRHHLLWTLRPRSVGEHALPELEVPLVRPDGRVQRLPLGALPFHVRSVREEVPEQEVFFDIRPAPQPKRRVPAAVLPALLVTALLGAGILLLRPGRRNQDPPLPDPEALTRESALSLEAAFTEPDARRLADRLVHALWPYIEGRWQIDTAPRTPVELPESVPAVLAEILESLERARFQKTPVREDVLELGRAARAALSDVARS